MQVNIIGTIVDSGGIPITGVLRVTLANSIANPDLTLNTLILPVTHEFPLINGVVDIDLAESETARASYTFEAYRFDEAELPDGAVYEDTPSWELTAIVPRSVLPVSINSLEQTGIRVSNGDSGIQAIVGQLVRSTSFKSLLGATFRDKGIYNDEENYVFNDIVYYPDTGRQYRCVANTAIQGILPVSLSSLEPDNLNSEFWARYGGDKGDPGTGILGDNTAYDFGSAGASWDGRLEAPAKDTLRDVIEALETKQHATNTFAPLESPNLTGNPTAPTQDVSDTSNRIATTAYVKNVATAANVGFVPVQQGGTVNFTNEKVYIGFDNSVSKLKAQVQNTLLGNFAFEPWVNQNFYTKNQVDTIFAPKANPTFTGNVIAPTVALGASDTRVATTAFVKGQNYQPNLGYTPIQQGGGANQLANKLYIGWTGSKLNLQVDSSNFGPFALESWVYNNYAPLVNPTLLGSPKSTTTVKEDISNNIATTAYTHDMVVNHPVNGFGYRSANQNGFQRLPGGIMMQWGQVVTTTNGAGDAPINYPVPFNGTPYSVVANNADGNSISGVYLTVWEINRNNYFSIRAHTTTGGDVRHANSLIRVSWVAFGPA